jgi:hypothetical protein
MENNIDKIFKNKLLQHQEKPSEQAWEKLEKAMYGKEMKRRSLGVYWQVAAAVALFLTVSFFYSQSGKKENLSAKLEKTKIEQPMQVKEAENELITNKNAELEEVKIAQPTISLAKRKIENATKEQKTKALESLPAEMVQNVAIKQAEEEVIATHQVAEIAGEKIATPQEDLAVEEEIRITVKFAEEVVPKQAKKSWLGKVVSTIKKKRQEEQARENEGNTEKATFSVFGIDTEKVFAKKKMAE